MINVDSGKRTSAIARFVELTQLTDKQAEKLVDFALESSVNQTLETVMGSGVVPTTLTLARVELLKSICLEMKQPLSQLEIQVLFRTTPSNAKLILTTMSATYAQSLRADFLTQMIADAVPLQTGSFGEFKWQVKFGQEASYETAYRELDKFDFLRFASCRRNLRYIEFPQVTNPASENHDLLSTLGLTPPPDSHR